ncbi:MAG: response regulator [Candidatus Viridilinea halotolerans]|uniref:Circadian input-output histidine kinase CikA n=1 Tax=Candidatus Viridilinea halotolerans TaxID=2491704 RepID=A0A426U0J4_9CHLR|nr:MAG: response regulator [Candidatus Viridilinea halotolerans]
MGIRPRINRLRYPEKFLLISLLFLLPLAVTMGFMVAEQNVRIRFAQKEIAGTEYLHALNEVYLATLLHRHEAMRALSLGITVESLPRTKLRVETAMAALRPLQADYGERLRTEALFQRIEAGWEVLRSDDLRGSALEGYERYQQLIDDQRALIATVGDYSNLILDPDLDSYYMMDAVLLRLPEAQAIMARILLVNEGLVPLPYLLAERRTELVMQLSLLRANRETLRRNLETAYTHTAWTQLRPLLAPEEEQYLALVDAMIAQYQEAATAPNRLVGTRELVNAGQMAMEGSARLSATTAPALETLLAARINALRQRQSFTVAFSLLLLLAAYATGIRLMRSISGPLNELLRATQRLAGGDLAVQVHATGQSEVARVGQAFNQMAQEVRTGRDLLEQRVLERTQALANTTRAAEEARINAEEARAAAEEATKAKSIFLANMSHELRTPLNAIIGYAEMLEEEAEDLGYDDFAPDLHKIRTAGRQLLALINDVLDISKIEAGRMELHLDRFALSTMIHDVTSTIEPLVANNNNRFVVSGDISGTLYNDLTRLRQSLLNLLSNAAKFTANGKITLEIENQNINGVEYLYLRVHDTGIGIAQEQLGQLFREFTQGDASTTRKYGGTGLGLALSRRFCQMMGGDITVSSRPDEGSTFTIVVPREVRPEEAVAHLVAASDVVPNGPVRGTVLVIDDDPATSELLQRTLSREGLRVVTAISGAEGLARARIVRPDVITLDVLLRDADGWQILAALKADPELANIPVVMLTILDERSTGFSLGAADYLTKPVDRRRLIELVGRYCTTNDDSSNEPPTVLVVEDDDTTREILCRTLDQAGWQTHEAANGRLGLEAVAAARPGLILLDLMMPELDGFGFLNELRSNVEWMHIPVIVVTAMDLTHEDRMLLTASAQRVIQKGAYERDQLLGEVRTLVARYTRQGPLL